jgi:RNA polymerase primary sigma factor
MDRAPLKLMEAAEREMRQIIYRFGFAARQHILRAEKLLACPSSERLDHVLAGSKFRSARQYLTTLPNLVKLVRALDQKAGSAYQKWRQDPPLANGGKYLAEFRRFNHELQRIFPKFCFQITVIQPMIAIAENLARQFRGSQRVQNQIHQARNPVCQLPLADVERQAIETMESFVRMPGDVFLLHCTRLKTLVAQFEQAKCQLLQEHLPLVASIAGTYRIGNLTMLPLMRAGIFGLLRAVEKYEYRYSWSFSNYAACSIRRSLRHALEA